MNFSTYSDKLLYTAFNQTGDCVIFTNRIGFYVYKIEPFKKIISRKIDGGVSIAKMLYKSNIITFVGNVVKGLYPNNKLIIWDDNKVEVIGEISFKQPILDIHLSKDMIVVILETKVFLYNFKHLSIIKVIDTCLNPRGLCSVLFGEHSLIALPDIDIGKINIVDYKNNTTNIIEAHTSELCLFTMDSSGRYIATSSVKGTLIRIYNVETCHLVKEYRRGNTQSNIVDIAFSTDLRYMLCGSEKGTIHVFNIMLHDEKTEEFSYLRTFLPHYFNMEYSTVKFYINDVVTHSLFVLDNRLISIGSNGCYYHLTFDIEKGTSSIETTYKFITDTDDPFNEPHTAIK